MRRTAILAASAMLSLAAFTAPGCTAPATSARPRPEPTRHAMVIGVKPDKLDYYKQLHAAPWPGVLAQLERSNVHNFSIHLVELREGEFTLFGYFEYTGDDFEADMAAMAADPETQRWWQETGPCQVAIPRAREEDGLADTSWFMMEEIFHAR